jgi:hypothetical protein
VRTRYSTDVCELPERVTTIRSRPFEPAFPDLSAAIDALDRIRTKVEEWGVVTISAPVAVFRPGAFKVPDDIVSATDLYNAARTDVSASAAIATQRGISNQFSGVASPLGLPALPATGRGGSATSTTTSTTTATGPTQPVAPAIPPVMDSAGVLRPTLNAEALTLPEAASIAGLPAVKDYLGLLEGWDKPKKSAGLALREAQDNLVREKIYSALITPESIPNYEEIIFCIVQVSCNPGWRTKEHYIADCSASLEYYDLCQKKGFPRFAMREPTVFSVLPLMDAQTVEMANSQREITQLAFQLAASLPAKGVDLKARDLFKFVKQYSRDLRSVTPVPVCNSYSSGGTFGFRFSPSFQALSDPAQKKARAANVLLPTTFPALITVILHHNDMRAAAAHFGYPNWSPAMELPPGFSVMSHVSTRWYLKDRPPLTQFVKRLVTPMKRDTNEIEVNAAKDVADFWKAEDYYKFRTRYPNYNPKTREFGVKLVENEVFDPALEELRRSIIDLQSKGIGKSWPIELGGQSFAEIKANVAKKTVNAEIEALKKKLDEADAKLKKNIDDNKDQQIKTLRELLDASLKQSSATPGEKVNRTASIPSLRGAIPEKASEQPVRALPAAVEAPAQDVPVQTTARVNEGEIEVRCARPAKSPAELLGVSFDIFPSELADLGPVAESAQRVTATAKPRLASQAPARTR